MSNLTFTVASVGGMFVSASKHEGVQGDDGALTFVTNRGVRVAERMRVTMITASFSFKGGPTSPMGRL